MSPYVVAAELMLTGTADDGARWFEYSSDAFAELGQEPDGFYAISSLPSVGSPFGTNVDVFPNDNAFDLGTIQYDEGSLLGSGVEVVMIDAYSVDFDLNIADDDALANGIGINPPQGYVTEISDLQGSIEFNDGSLTSIDLSATITFTYSYLGSPFSYVGSFTMSGDRFDLLVDGTNFVAGEDRRYAWEASGVVDQVNDAPPIAGDYNGDGFVDALDFQLWSSQYGGVGPESDGNLDGVVDAADYTIWRDNETAALSSRGVPEPSSAVLCACALVSVTGRLRPSN